MKSVTREVAALATSPTAGRRAWLVGLVAFEDRANQKSSRRGVDTADGGPGDGGQEAAYVRGKFGHLILDLDTVLLQFDCHLLQALLQGLIPTVLRPLWLTFWRVSHGRPVRGGIPGRRRRVCYRQPSDAGCRAMLGALLGTPTCRTPTRARCKPPGTCSRRQPDRGSRTRRTPVLSPDSRAGRG